VSGVDRLIVGTSGSPGSLQALRYGERMARAHGAVLIPVLAWELPGGDYGERVHPSGELRQVWRNSPADGSGTRSSQCGARFPTIRCSSHM